MAARSLIQLFREKNPGLLHKKDRVSQDEAGIQRHLNFFIIILNSIFLLADFKF